MHNKKYLMVLTLVATLVAASFIIGYQVKHTDVYIDSNIGLSSGIDNPTESKEVSSVHCRIRMYQEGNLVMDQYHSGVVTDLGDNATLAKLFGDASYNLTQYDMNATYISIGNDGGSLASTVTVLPAEWNRTIGTIEDQAQSQLNITCTFNPTTGPFTADCIGLNFEGGIGVDDSLWAYDTFSEVTGIDETFTINIEFQISVSHS